MIFVGVAIVISVGIALLISADAGAFVGLSQQQTGQLIPALVILIVMASALFSRRQQLGTMVRNVLLWAGLFGVALVGYTYRDDLQGIAARVMGELTPGAATVDTARGSATFRAGRDGHYQINAMINGTEITTIFDTGASAVVLTEKDAVRAGLDVANLNYNVQVSTANGTGRAASVLLDQIEVGGIVRKRIRAFVAEADALEQSLLGMTFLSTLSSYGVSANSLELVD